MSASFAWSQINGSFPGVRQDIGVSGNLFNFKNLDTVGTSGYDTFPIRAGNNSYEVYLQAHWYGSFSAIYDVRFWQSTAFAPTTGLTIRAHTQRTVYTQPTNATSSIATSTVSSSDPGAANVSIGGSLTSSLTSSGYSDFLVMQLQTTTAAPAGDTSLGAWTLSYLEV